MSLLFMGFEYWPLERTVALANDFLIILFHSSELKTVAARGGWPFKNRPKCATDTPWRFLPPALSQIAYLRRPRLVFDQRFSST